MNKKILFSPPDITIEDINEVIDTLKSGWITTGPKTKLFEEKIAYYCDAPKAICLNSATAGMELILRLYGIGAGDEVITTPYTFAATANVILHVGAKPVFVDIKDDCFNIDPRKIESKINDKTKAVITVDFAGYPVDYKEIKEIIVNKKKIFQSKKDTLQESFNRILFLADCAHSFGALYNGKKIGFNEFNDFSVFSFHAVKNITTSEGGAISFKNTEKYEIQDIYKKLQLFSLHGQSKDALSKFSVGGWKYNIELAGYKYNMTDIQASLGIHQIERYDNILMRRKEIYHAYNEHFKSFDFYILPKENIKNNNTSYHLYPLRIRGIDENCRDKIIKDMAEIGISLNVHFIPLPMHSLYQKNGYKMENYPNAYKHYQNEISLPIYSTLSINDANYVANSLTKIVLKYVKHFK